MSIYLPVLFLLFLRVSLADHYKGGTISWRPVNPYSLAATVELIIEHRQTFSLSRYPCDLSAIYAYGVMTDNQNAPPPALTCISSSGLCSASGYQIVNSSLFCTDFSTILTYSTGIVMSRQTLPVNTDINIAWRGAAWTLPINTNAFSLVSRMSLTRLNNGKINTSPVTGSLPVVRVRVNIQTVIPILATDWDSEQVVRCRWSYQIATDECGNVCLNLPGARLDPIDCFLTWTPVLRSEDIANGLNESTYVVAITAEDFANASSNTPLSATPHQMLIHVYTPPTNSCSTLPTLVSYPRKNQACFAAYINSAWSVQVRVQVNCVGDTIVEMPTLTPFGMNHSDVFKVNNITWGMNFYWIPRINQTGVQPFCVGGIDNNGLATSHYCVAIAVGANATAYPSLIYVQGSWSPVGTVMSTQRRFSIQTNMPLKRPVRNGSQIRVVRVSDSALVWSADTRFSPDVYYINTTLVFYTRTAVWTPGATYYVVMTEGVATSDQACGVEAASFGDSRAWRFTIWDSAASSSTTLSTTTSTATTHTVTTRTMATTTPNTLYTTTGLAAYTRTTTTTTTSTTSTSATTTTTTSATTTTTTTTTTTEYIPNAIVIYPKDMETECLQPVTIATVLITTAILPIHLYAMITLFSKMNTNFQQETLKKRNLRHQLADSSFDQLESQSFV